LNAALFAMYTFFYGAFDKTIHMLDTNAYKSKRFPNLFMSAVSIFGLGFQLLIISVLLFLGYKVVVIPFFIGYTALIFVFIGIRRLL